MGVMPAQPGDEPQRLGVVVKAAIGRHQPGQRILSGMAEGRVAEVMRQRDRLGEVRVPVSYTHLTLPTSDLVYISVVAVSLKKKKRIDEALRQI